MNNATKKENGRLINLNCRTNVNLSKMSAITKGKMREMSVVDPKNWTTVEGLILSAKSPMA